MSERGDLGEEARLDRLGPGQVERRPLCVDEQLNRLDAGRERRLHEIFALTTEQTQALALAA